MEYCQILCVGDLQGSTHCPLKTLLFPVAQRFIFPCSSLECCGPWGTWLQGPISEPRPPLCPALGSLTRIQSFRFSRISESLDVRNPGYQNPWISETLDIRISGYQNPRISESLASPPRSPPPLPSQEPGLQESWEPCEKVLKQKK